MSLFEESPIVVWMPTYQIPRLMSTMPIANHPMTPIEIIVSSVMPVSDGFGVGFEFESDSADFITRGKFLIVEQMDAQP